MHTLTFYTEMSQCFDLFWFIFQHCHVTLKLDFVDGIRTKVTTLTGQCSVGWTTPPGSVRSFKTVDTLQYSSDTQLKVRGPNVAHDREPGDTPDHFQIQNENKLIHTGFVYAH